MYEITNKDLLKSTGNSTQYSVLTYNGKESEKRIYIYMCVCVCVCAWENGEHFSYITESLCCTPETTQYCKSTIISKMSLKAGSHLGPIEHIYHLLVLWVRQRKYRQKINKITTSHFKFLEENTKGIVMENKVED